jgi:hypothetical protein
MRGPGTRNEERGTNPETALRDLAATLRAEDTVISPHVLDPDAEPALGLLAAAGPRAAGSPAEYSLLVESVREGYLLHYAKPRLLEPGDRDLALLAGDYLYALGLERLAKLGDDDAVAQLSDLISLCAELHAEGQAELTAPLWLACVSAVGGGGNEQLERAKGAARALDTDATRLLWESAEVIAGAASGELARGAEAIDFTPPR